MTEKVHSIGFPKSEIEKGNLTFESISEKIGAKNYEVKDENIVFLLNDGDNKNDYKVWMETLHAENNIEIVIVGFLDNLYWFSNIKIGYGFGKIKRYTKRKKNLEKK